MKKKNMIINSNYMVMNLSFNGITYKNGHILDRQKKCGECIVGKLFN